MNIRLLKDGNAPQVTAYVETHKKALIYHTLNWRNLLSTAYGYSSRYVIAEECGRICGMLPLFLIRKISGRKKLTGLPYSHDVPVLYDSPEALSAMLSFAETMTRSSGADYLEIRHDVDVESEGWQKTIRSFISLLDLKRDLKEIKKGIKSGTLRNIKKACKSGICVYPCRGWKDYHLFYELMIDTRKRQGSPPYSEEFFRLLFTCLSSAQQQLYMAYHNGMPIAGILMLYHGERAIYAYGASVSDQALLRYRPNELLFWRAICDAHQAGFRYFDFGTTPAGHDSLLHFKSRWGPKTSEMVCTCYLNRRSAVPEVRRSGLLFNTASESLKRLPRPVLKKVGPILLRLLG